MKCRSLSSVPFAILESPSSATLFSLIGIKERLWRCFRHLKDNPIYGHHMIMMLLVVHLSFMD